MIHPVEDPPLHVRVSDDPLFTPALLSTSHPAEVPELSVCLMLPGEKVIPALPDIATPMCQEPLVSDVSACDCEE
jgi:hypothetical protein